ncbi:hypothetical protein BGZ67_006605 [Mortierella alpina]|nr:hypothetical protein BGZ67_006605 [Mortierella alpina]
MPEFKTSNVPRPRPGELLIYDCRPRATVPDLQQNLAQQRAHPSSPPTPMPMPALQHAVFEQEAAGDHCAPSPRGEPASSSAASSAPTPAINTSTATAQPTPSTAPQDRPIRCLQWNIERNYKAAEILATLTEIDADILCIQEIDIGCHRSGHERDHFLEICRSQGLYGGFVPEFWELEHPGRKDRDQGGGVHGNAILSRWPVNGFRVLDHVHHAYEWERDGMKLNEPRLGRRFTIVADIQTPSGPLLCYCAHLEVFTGIVGRISALSDILADSELYSDRYPYQILFGDLNTISHSIARLAKTISSDQYRIGSVGSQEAEWWDRNLWSWHVQDGEFNLTLATGGWHWLRRLGFLGMGIGAKEDDSENGRSGLWTSDAKYTGWLRKLVGAGLEAVKQARLEQLLSDKFIAAACELPLDSQSSLQQQQEHLRHAMDESILQEDHCTSMATEEAESYRSYQEDGSIILVGRPRSSSIITLESSLMDRSEYMSPASSSAWSSPTTAFIQHYELHGDSDEDEDEDGDGHSGEFKLRADTTQDIRDLASTPSTPSPTLRLIPPTPKQSRPNTVFGTLTGRENPPNSNGRGDEERGIPLPYEDEDENDDYDQVDGEAEYRHRQERSRTHQDDGHSRQYHTFTNTQLHDNDLQYPNDPNATMTFTTATTTTEMTSRIDDHPATTFTTTTATTKTTSTSSTTATCAGGSVFQDPQPPFLLSALQTSHAFFSTQRLWSGFTPLVLHQARNPGFYDPWCARNDLTLHNPNFFGILKAKLDYSLLKNLRCVGRDMGNHDYSASDHKWLLVEVEFEREFRTRLENAGSRTAASASASAVDVGRVNDGKLEEWVIPSKEQQYLWWRERRLEWGQTVQALPPHLRTQDNEGGSDAAVALEEQTKALQQENTLLRKHPHRRHHRHHHQQQQEQQKRRALTMSASSMIAAAVAAVAIGGLWLWHRRK